MKIIGFLALFLLTVGNCYAGQQLNSVLFGGTIWACGNKEFATHTDTWTNTTGQTIYIVSGDIWSGTDYGTVADTNGVVIDQNGDVLGRQLTDRYANPNQSNTTSYGGGQMNGHYFAIPNNGTVSLTGNCQRYLTAVPRHIQYWSDFWYVTTLP